MDKVLNMTYASSLTNLCEVNSSFDAGILRICYTNGNRNGSFISRETIEKCLPSIYNCPLVCNYDRETDTLGGHDMEVVQDSDGGLHVINVTTPVGVIPESAHVYFDNYEEDDGTVHEYLYAEVLLWKRQEAYRKIKKDGITAHSMEIKVNDGRFVDGIYHIDDFEFNAFCLISEEPCFESSALEVFAKNDFKQKMSEMMHDLKDTLIMVNPSKEGDNIHSQNYSTEGGKKALDEKHVSNAEPTPVAIEGEPDEKFALTGNIVEEIRHALSVERIRDEWGDDIPHYFYVDCDFDAREVYCWDACDWLLYGFMYALNGDKVAIDFGSKKRKKYVIADFDEGEQVSPVAQVFELVKEKLVDYADVKSKFASASETIASMQNELASLRAFKADIDDKNARDEREKVFAQFEDLNGIESYEALKEECMNYDAATIEEKCFAIRGRNATALKFSAKEKTPKLKVSKADDSREPYGGLFVKYAADSSN